MSAEVKTTMHHRHVEDMRKIEHDGPEENQSFLKLDARGVPLSPQPTDHPDDPLNWSTWYKYYVLLAICMLAFVCQFGAGMVPAAFADIAEDFNKTEQQASYLTTSYVLFCGVTPLLVTPFVNTWGRRPAYCFCTLITLVSNIGLGYASTYAGEIVSRCAVGIGASAVLAFGGSTICDVFFEHERGLFLGLYALALTNGPHFGPIAGGYISQNLGWRWIFYINAVMQGFFLLVFLLTVPETLFSRTQFSNLENRSYWSRLAFRGKVLDRKIRLKDFGSTFRMLQYWAVLLPIVYYGTANAFGSILFVLTASTIFGKLYHYDTGKTGVLLGVPLTIGCIIGECFTGWVSDALANRYATRHGGHRKPEVRLYLAFLALLCPVGLIITGACVTYRTHWIGVVMGEAIASVGSQAATTLTYSYCNDCYKPQSAEVSSLINLSRNLVVFTVGFYALPFAKRYSFLDAWGTFAAINFAFWLPLLFLFWKGESIRQRQGLPTMHADL